MEYTVEFTQGPLNTGSELPSTFNLSEACRRARAICAVHGAAHVVAYQLETDPELGELAVKVAQGIITYTSDGGVWRSGCFNHDAIGHEVVA